MAWQQTRGRKGFVRESPPSDDLVWGTTALAGATTWVHLDANGLSTQIDNVSGTKYLVLFNRRRQCPKPCGDMSSLHAFPDNWKPWSAGSEFFQHEGIILTPGSLL
jgi:hypothetical protein